MPIKYAWYINLASTHSNVNVKSVELHNVYIYIYIYIYTKYVYDDDDTLIFNMQHQLAGTTEKPNPYHIAIHMLCSAELIDMCVIWFLQDRNLKKYFQGPLSPTS